ncbi:RNA polymerase sigma factor [Paenibacillus sp. MWE-103]|uniref:RNA polymerase sigma factor n=1 Tax=Paenibacillus artemisiicola TaxID=1172618 RepID=A0ABS3W485_9BACL|nr:RNA polymerase sigma factor [Paenibacillus artemisiicola]MBO7743021.1 RNA polymerase sigma factor [Paenibacillus artemisiicola]
MRRPLLRYCRQLTGCGWDAEDLAQEAILRLLGVTAEKPARDISFRYACRTARNLWIDRTRRSSRIAMVPYPEEAPRGAFGASDDELDVREHLEELAWRLPPKPFVILLFMDVFDFTAKETAAWLGGSEVAAQVALSRARARLRAMKRDAGEKGAGRGNRPVNAAAGNASGHAAFFEAVLNAFRERQPAAIQEAYLALSASGARLNGIRALGGKTHFAFQDPDGNVLMVVSAFGA